MQSPSFSQEQPGVDFRAYLGMFLYHRWQVLCCVVVGLVFGAYQASGARPEYKATAVIKVEKKGADLSPKASSGTAVFVGRVEQPFAEELQLLNTRAFLGRVAQRLNHEIELLPLQSPTLQRLVRLKMWLLGSRDLPGVSLRKTAPVKLHDVQVGQETRSGVYTLMFTDTHSFVVSPAGDAGSITGSLDQRFTAWGFSFVVTGGPVEPGMRLVFRVRNAEEFVAMLRRSLSLSVVKDTSLMQITATTPDPQWTKDVVQTAIEEYTAFGQQQREQGMAQSLGYIDRQLEVVLSNIEIGLNAVRGYKEQHPLAALAEDTKGLIGQSASYEVQLRKVEENLTTAQGLLDTLQGRSNN